MGIPFFPTLIYDYLILSIDNLKQINLSNQCVIIDGNASIHFLYNEIVKEDKIQPMSQRLTGTLFGYDGCWKKFSDILTLFKKQCLDVIVVFDGILKSNSRRREDPRSSNIYYSDIGDQKQLPTLLRHEFLNILYELDIRTIVAQGEADLVIVRMAQENDAYIVSCDSDYHLYQLPQGFIPLRYLNLETLTGPCFHLTDVFGCINAEGVALWATLIGNTFVENFEKLQTFFSTKFVYDKRNFGRWLEKTKADVDKREWTTIQLSLLRFIQNVGTNAAYSQLIKCISQTDRAQFDQIMQSYINIQPEAPFHTRSDNGLPHDIEQRYIGGKLDRKLIEILINAQLPTSWQELSSLNFRLLLPICHILLKWNYEHGESASVNPIVTHKEQQYNLFEILEFKNMPSLNDIPNLSMNDQKYYVLYCIHFTFQCQLDKYLDHVDDDYILWLSLLKLWFHEQNKNALYVESVLPALIISFLKHVLLDTYDEEERNVFNEPVSSPLLQYSSQKLKNKFSLEVCASLRQNIDRYSETILPIESITSALHEFEQVYDCLGMINQFFGDPLHMPSPHTCISQLTYRLAVFFSNSKNISKQIKLLFQDHELLVDMTQEIREFICTN